MLQSAPKQGVLLFSRRSGPRSIFIALRVIRVPYWMGIAADTLWAVALFVPSVFGMLVGIPNFAPDLQFKLTMTVGGTLMTGWTFLLLWAEFREGL